MMFLNKIMANGGFTLTGELQDKSEGFAIALEGHETIFEANKMTEQDVLSYRMGMFFILMVKQSNT